MNISGGKWIKSGRKWFVSSRFGVQSEGLSQELRI